MALKTLQYRNHTFNISYEIVNPQGKRDIVFLHGWGWNKELMKQAFASHLDTFRHIYVDLPGFGNSTCDMPLSTEDYATILESFYAQVNIERDIVVGHSFGGKVATLINPDLLVLIAASGVVLPKPLSVRMKIGLTKLLKPFGIKGRFRAPDAQALTPAMYETFKGMVNEDFMPRYGAFAKKALLLWGKADTATPLHTAYTIAGAMRDARVVEFEGDHYFLMQQHERIAEEITKSYLQILEH